MFFFRTLRSGVLTFDFTLPYSVSVETKKLTEAKVIAKLSEWVRNLKGILDCADFKGVIVLEMHLDVANGSCVIRQQFKPG